MANGGRNLGINNHVRRVIKRGRRDEQDVITLGARKVRRAAAELIGSSAVRPQLRGCHTKVALDPWVREIKSARYYRQIDGNKVMRP